MECPVCERHKSSLFCKQCISKRLAEHLSLRSALRSQTAEHRARCLSLLTPPSSATLGVEEERLLKAEKWATAWRVRDLRVKLDELGTTVPKEREDADKRRKELAKRRENLLRARAGLGAQVAGEQGDALRVRQQKAIVVLSARETALALEQARSVLCPALGQAYGLMPGTIAGLPIPRLSTLATTASPYEAQAALLHLLHLARLLALYTGTVLPHMPLPSLYGPARPGLKSVLPLLGGPSTQKKPADGGTIWPLFFGSSAGSGKKKGGRKESPNGTVPASASAASAALLRAAAVKAPTSSLPSSSSAAKAKAQQSTEVTPSLRAAVLALSWNFATLAFARGFRRQASESTQEEEEEEASVILAQLDDVGLWAHRAVYGPFSSGGERSPWEGRWPEVLGELVSSGQKRKTTPVDGEGVESLEEGDEEEEEEWDLV